MITLDDLQSAWDEIDALRDSTGVGLVERPAGWVTIAEYAARYGTGRDAAQRQLDRLVEAGKLQRERCYIVSGPSRKVGWCYGVPK